MTQTFSKIFSAKAHARLHVGFFDLCGGAESRFGSVGFALESPVTEFEATLSDEFSIIGDIDVKSRENIAKSIQKLQKIFNLQTSLKLNIKQLITTHAGLGSGTQLVLSLVALFDAAYDLQLSQAQIAQLSGRGIRSGIGLGAFFQGGFLVDSGRQGDALPEIVLRHDFPEAWRIILVSDAAHVGLHGEHELSAFQTLKPMQNSLKSMVFDQVVPALECADLLAFGAGIDDLQAYNGAYFAPIQGGKYASKKVEIALTWLKQNGVVCVGQSSWGPTGFAIVEDKSAAQLYLEQLKKQFAANADLSFAVTQGYNQGATIKAE